MKIVLGTDGSTHARIAETLLVKVAAWRRATVSVVSVMSPPHIPIVGIQPYGAAALAEEVGRMTDQLRERARQTVDAACERLESDGLKATGFVLEGEPSGEILDFANKEGADLVAIGSRGHGMLRSLFVGSVARKLISSAPCSVLVARSYANLSPEDSLQRLKGKGNLVAVVGVDGTDGSNVGLDMLIEAGPGSFEKVVAACAEPLSVLPAGIDPTAFADFYKYDHERATAVATAAMEKLAAVGFPAKSSTNLGRPADILSEAAIHEDADLIVVGATRHGTLERMLVGSVSFEVATSAPCSVLVVRPRAS